MTQRLQIRLHGSIARARRTAAAQIPAPLFWLQQPRIFARSGLDGARTDAIAAAAGVNKAMLYYYFKSKDLLYSAVLENHFKEFHRRAMEVLDARTVRRARLCCGSSKRTSILSAASATTPCFSSA